MCWCITMPSSAFSWLPFSSTLNQDLDPPTPGGFLDLGDHRPLTTRAQIKSRKLTKVPNHKYNKNQKEDKFGVIRPG